MVDIQALEDMKVPAGTEKSNKYLQFPDKETFNELVDLMLGADETKDLLEEFTSGGDDVEDFNSSINVIINAVNKQLKSEKNENAKAALEKEKERLEKKLKGNRNPTLAFILKFILATNQYSEIQELSKRIK
jgi:hypothetical protein